MNKAQLLMHGALITLLLGSSTAIYADNSELANNCRDYLTSSNEQFMATYKNNTISAANAADVLNQCLVNNVCSELDGITDCSSKLAQRDYLINFYKMAPADNSNGYIPFHVSNTPPPMPQRQQTQSSQPTKAETTAPALMNSNNPYVAPLMNQTQQKKTKPNGINWF